MRNAEFGDNRKNFTVGRRADVTAGGERETKDQEEIVRSEFQAYSDGER